VAIPRERVAEVLDKSRAREDKEADVMRKLEAGETSIDLYGWDR
jgi:4-hydroxy-4-methyl-2-oxoglutarate aldolase